MNNARENILQRIRRANVNRLDMDSRELIVQREKQHAHGPQPQWSEPLRDRFIKKAEQSAATVATVHSEQDIVPGVMRYLADQSLDDSLLCASTPLINRLKWPESIAIQQRAATTDDRVTLVEAFAAIAETGSIVMCSGSESPVSLNFLPDYFICVVSRICIVKSIEDVWAKIRSDMNSMPRAVNIITGPSRTADVEQIIQMGAHGPRKVHLLLIG